MEKLFSGLTSAIRLAVSGLPVLVAPSHRAWTECNGALAGRSRRSLQLTLSTVVCAYSKFIEHASNTTCIVARIPEPSSRGVVEIPVIFYKS